MSYGPQNLYSSYRSLSLVVPRRFLAGKALYSAAVAEGPRYGGQMGAADRRPHYAPAPEEREVANMEAAKLNDLHEAEIALARTNLVNCDIAT